MKMLALALASLIDIPNSQSVFSVRFNCATLPSTHQSSSTVTTPRAQTQRSVVHRISTTQYAGSTGAAPGGGAVLRGGRSARGARGLVPGCVRQLARRRRADRTRLHGTLPVGQPERPVALVWGAPQETPVWRPPRARPWVPRPPRPWRSLPPVRDWPGGAAVRAIRPGVRGAPLGPRTQPAGSRPVHRVQDPAQGVHLQADHQVHRDHLPASLPAQAQGAQDRELEQLQLGGRLAGRPQLGQERRGTGRTHGAGVDRCGQQLHALRRGLPARPALPPEAGRRQRGLAGQLPQNFQSLLTREAKRRRLTETTCTNGIFRKGFNVTRFNPQCLKNVSSTVHRMLLVDMLENLIHDN